MSLNITSDEHQKMFKHRKLIASSLEGVPSIKSSEKKERKQLFAELTQFSQMKVHDLLELNDSKGISASILRDLGVETHELAPDDLGSVEIEEYMRVVGESFNSRIKNIQLSSIQHVLSEGAVECISKNEEGNISSRRMKDFDKGKNDAILEGVKFLGDGEICKSGEDCIQVKFILPKEEGKVREEGEDYIVMTFTSQTDDEILYKHDLIVLKNLLEVKNISEFIKEKSLKMKYKYSDGDTELYNSTYFKEVLNRPDHDYSGIFIDVSSFKKINDENGQTFGNNALIKVARFLESQVRANDRVVRIGGDEFFILFNNAGTTEENRDESIKNLIDRIQKKSKEELFLSNGTTEVKLKLVFGYASSSKEDAKNGISLLAIANDMLNDNKDPAGEAYRILSMFKTLKPKAVKPALIELMSNQVFSDEFFPALLQSEGKGDYFFVTFMNILGSKISELSKGNLDPSDQIIIEDNIRYLQLMRDKTPKELEDFFLHRAA